MKNRKVNRRNLIIGLGVIGLIVGIVFVMLNVGGDIRYVYIGLALMSPFLVCVIGWGMKEIAKESYNAVFPKQEEK